MSSTPRSTRRQFLQGRSAADAIVGLTGAADAWAPPSDAAPDAYLLKLSRRAMACQFEFLFNAGQYPLANELGLAALDLVDRLEDQLSVFREQSEISRLNRHAADEPIAVEPQLFRLLRRAVEFYERTAGAFDVTAGPLSQVWGFVQRAGAMPDQDALAAARERVGSDALGLDDDSTTVRFGKPGLEINLGSIGKANPPFRAPEDCEALWTALADGTINVVASDHVPRKRATKEKRSEEHTSELQSH